MSKKCIQKAAGEGRVAVLPEWLQEGRRVWLWRECFCDDGDLCEDSVTPACPLNSFSGRPDVGTTARCARYHPQLDSTTVWAVSAEFTPKGIFWMINEAYRIRDCFLREAVFPSREAAQARRPEVIAYE